VLVATYLFCGILALWFLDVALIVTVFVLSLVIKLCLVWPVQLFVGCINRTIRSMTKSVPCIAYDPQDRRMISRARRKGSTIHIDLE